MTGEQRLRAIMDSGYAEDSLIFFDGLNDAIVGLATMFNITVVCYSRKKILEHFMAQGMGPDEAEEFVAYNIDGLYCGEKTPAILVLTEELT